MKDVKYLLRSAYFTLLNGNLTTNLGAPNTPVPVSDTLDEISPPDNCYVLLVSEDGKSENTHQSFMMEEKICVRIVARGSRISTKVLDDLANQILAIILPIPQNNAFNNPQIINCRIVDDRYMRFTTEGGLNVAQRFITFSQTIAQ